jgi:hypothetical protein
MPYQAGESTPRSEQSAFGCHLHMRRAYLWLLSVMVTPGLDDTETLVAPSGEALRKDARTHRGRRAGPLRPRKLLRAFAASQPREREAHHRPSRPIAASLSRRSWLCSRRISQPRYRDRGDGRSALPCRPLLLLDDLATKADALVADVDARPSDQPAYFALRLPTERAAQRAIDPLRGWRALEHEPSVFPFEANSRAAMGMGGLPGWQAVTGFRHGHLCRQVVAPEPAGSLDKMQNSLPSGSASVIQPLPSGRR